MSTFYYNSAKNEGIISQWLDYLQQKSFVNDIKDILNQNHKELIETIRNSTAEQNQIIRNVCGQLEEMNSYLQNIDYNISKLRGEINEMASMLDWKLSQLIEEQKITNKLLGNIAQILRIPDSQRQRNYHIENGIKYLKNAYFENDVNSSYYKKAFEELKKAEKIENKDYITLNKIGQIYLYSGLYVNFNKAEEYFRKSAEESYAEAVVNGTTVSNYLTPYGYETEIYSKTPFLAATAESYLYAGRACYLQRELDKAIDYASKAYNLIPNFLQAGFELAKYLSANNNKKKSEKILRKVIKADREFIIKTLKDKDLFDKENIQYLLNEIRNEAISVATKRINVIKKEISSQSKAKKIFAEINKYYDKGSFLSVMKSIDIMNAKISLEYKTYTQSNYNTIKVSKQKYIGTILNFIKMENKNFDDLERIKLKVKKSTIFENTKSGIIYGAGVGFFIFGSLIAIFVQRPYAGLIYKSFFLSAIAGGYIGNRIKPKIKYE